jgi:glycosyl transferase family 25
MKVAYFLINLDDNIERLGIATEQLQSQGIQFERISAFDGRGLNPADHPLYNSHKARKYMGRELVGGEIGCYLSHMDCALKFLSSDADYAVVFEDDFKISHSLDSKIKSTLDFLKTNESWQLINIGNEKLKISTEIHSISIENNRHALHKAHYFPMTTTGLIWNRSGAKGFLDISTEIFAPVDNFLRYWMTKTNTGLAFKPSLVTTIGAASVIDSGIEKNKRKKHGRVFFYGLIKQRRLWSDKIKAFYRKIFN